MAQENWQTTGHTIKERNKLMFNNTLISDVKFVFSPNAKADTESVGKKVSIPAHKYVLSISSPVFFAMFYGDLAEVNDTIQLPDCESESFLEFLRYIYCDEVNISETNVLQLLYIAKKYIVPSLAEQCVQFLQKNVSESNVFDMLPHAKTFELSELDEQCWRIVDIHTLEAVNSESFLEIDANLLSQFLQRESLTAREIDLFKAVDSWATSKCEKEGRELIDKRVVLTDDVIRLIRFPLMTQKEFAEHVPSTGILSKDEIIDVFKYFSSVPVEELKFSAEKHSVKQTRCIQRVSRFSRYGQGWGYSGPSDQLQFSVDNPLDLHGARFFGSKDGQYTILVNLNIGSSPWNMTNETLVSTTTFDTDVEPKNGFYGFDVLFETPVHLEEGVNYVLDAQIVGPASQHGMGGADKIECNGVLIDFSTVWSGNGTNASRGQFAEFIFSTRN